MSWVKNYKPIDLRLFIERLRFICALPVFALRRALRKPAF